MRRNIWTDSVRPEVSANPFPPTNQALSEPNGLLAHGGDLTPETLLIAYAQGIFPWFSEGQEILWWSPDPRMVLKPDEIHISRSLRKTIRNSPWQLRYDTDFINVIKGCAAPRGNVITDADTWITPDMLIAYSALHHLGVAHSIEIYAGDNLIGGLYGLLIDQIFFGESMFHRETEASKLAFVALAKICVDLEVELIDCQVQNPHLESLGACSMPRQDFEKVLRGAIKQSMPSILANPRGLLPKTPQTLDMRATASVVYEARDLL